MSSPEKQKGDRAERAVLEFLRRHGFDAHRIRAGSPDDIGDLELDPDLVLEVKDRGKIDLPAWLRNLAVQKANKDAAFGVVIVKKRGSSDPLEWGFVLDGPTFVNVLRRLFPK